MSSGPGTGALLKTEDDMTGEIQKRPGLKNARRRRDPTMVERLPPRLVADTSAVAYYDAQRWVITACADSVRCMGRYPSLVAVLERMRKKAVVQYEEADEEMRQMQRRNWHGVSGVPVKKSATVSDAADDRRKPPTKRHQKQKRLAAAAAMQHKTAAAFKQEGQKFFATPGSGTTTLPAIK